MLTEKEYWFWLCNINGIGYKKITSLLMYFNTPHDVFYAKEEQLRQITGLNKKDIAYLCLTHDENQVKSCYERIEQSNVRFIIRDDTEYPSRLKQIFDPPYGIYVKGILPQDSKPTLAIIGARNCTNYGKELAIYFAKKLASEGIQIISGLAAGVDGYGHLGALEGNGYTLGVLGCGINRCYPECNLSLYKRMEEKGGIISEYGFSVLPRAGNFPRRNRIIAGLSDGILVVEARQRSGSFITVDQGLEQGKEIFCIPGRITDELSVGCNRLGNMGATIVCHPNDILTHLMHNNISRMDNQSRLIFFHDNSESKEEKMIMEQLSLVPVSLSELADNCKLSLDILTETMVQLQLKGKVKEVSRYHYVKLLMN